MATPLNDDSRTLFKFMADDQWHDYDVVRDAVAKAVPPGRALRKYETRLLQNRDLRKDGRDSSSLTTDEQIFYGARACAQITITSWKGRGLIQRIENGVKQIRRKPGFAPWGLDEPAAEPQDPGKEAGGSPEVPPDDPKPVEAVLPSVEQPPAIDPVEPEVVPEPVVQKPVDVADSAEQWMSATADLARESRGYEWPAPSQSVIAQEAAQCPRCGLAVVNRERHEQWHTDQDEVLDSLEKGLVGSAELKNILEKVFGDQLDAFQQGMQGWLIQQFTQLAMAFGAQSPVPARWSRGPSGGPNGDQHRGKSANPNP